MAGIGRVVGMDHSSVLHVRDRIAENPDLLRMPLTVRGV